MRNQKIKRKEITRNKMYKSLLIQALSINREIRNTKTFQHNSPFRVVPAPRIMPHWKFHPTVIKIKAMPGINIVNKGKRYRMAVTKTILLNNLMHNSAGE